VLIVFITAFVTWPYIGRIVRGQALALREREFVDAARSMGASTPRILLTEMLPNLFAPILVYTTLLIPTNILFEAALSFLGVGVRPPNPHLGRDVVRRHALVPDRPALRAVAGPGDLRDRARVQPVRRRAARRPRPPVALTSK
jgi:ABC-type dipeptide/oligopeptide/nickel transport system permease subunit